MERLAPVALAMAAAVVVALLAAVALGARRGASERASLQALEAVARTLGQLQSELARLARGHEELRQSVQRGGESSLKELARAAEGIRSEIGEAQRALAEVKALEQGRARQMDLAADSLRRLEAVVAGSYTRGAAGENILSRALAQLPPELLERNVGFGGKVVEYALRLPGGRFLPVDSKWTSAASLERLADSDDPEERRRLTEQIARELRGRVREVTKYLDPERTLLLGLLAVPDAVYAVAPEAQAEAYRDGVVVVPYSLALPYLLALYRLSLRLGSSLDAESLASRLRAIEESLRRADEELEGRLSRGLVLVANAREALRDELGKARHAAERLGAEPSPASGAQPGPRLPSPGLTAGRGSG